jgi:HAMP domain-containing protein
MIPGKAAALEWLWAALAMLLAWAGIAAWRRAGERARDPLAGLRSVERRREQRSRDDEIDRDELERAEREVRDLDPRTRPEDGFQGDDWGPGVPRPPIA